MDNDETLLSFPFLPHRDDTVAVTEPFLFSSSGSSTAEFRRFQVFKPECLIVLAVMHQYSPAW